MRLFSVLVFVVLYFHCKCLFFFFFFESSILMSLIVIFRLSIQPLTILGVTGPFSVLAENIYSLCQDSFKVRPKLVPVYLDYDH